MQAAVGEAGAPLGHFALEEDGTPTPLRLGAVHRQVRLADHVFELGAVVGEQRDADAGAHMVVTPAEIGRQRQ